eukprot:5816463-Pleurochrysis_carterae.AAC.1
MGRKRVACGDASRHKHRLGTATLRMYKESRSRLLSKRDVLVPLQKGEFCSQMADASFHPPSPKKGLPSTSSEARPKRAFSSQNVRVAPSVAGDVITSSGNLRAPSRAGP